MARLKAKPARKTATKSKPTVEPIITFAWLSMQFAELNRKLNILLVGAPINKDLENAINRNQLLAKGIDRQVPDNPTKGK